MSGPDIFWVCFIIVVWYVVKKLDKYDKFVDDANARIDAAEAEEIKRDETEATQQQERDEIMGGLETVRAHMCKCEFTDALMIVRKLAKKYPEQVHDTFCIVRELRNHYNVADEPERERVRLHAAVEWARRL